ncbi:MAG TPA: hypothetical protein VLS92_01980 [Acidimicrobiia bacterium]|nr:hypothetical protein [Acidimicrobiia bacterium]
MGEDRFEAQLIAGACPAAGVRVELLTADDSGIDPDLGIIQRHRLLVTQRCRSGPVHPREMGPHPRPSADPRARPPRAK